MRLRNNSCSRESKGRSRPISAARFFGFRWVDFIEAIYVKTIFVATSIISVLSVQIIAYNLLWFIIH
jgi:hypothetical protein